MLSYQVLSKQLNLVNLKLLKHVDIDDIARQGCLVQLLLAKVSRLIKSNVQIARISPFICVHRYAMLLLPSLLNLSVHRLRNKVHVRSSMNKNLVAFHNIDYDEVSD